MTAHAVESFRACVLSKIGRLTPKHAAQITADVADDWGPACRRRVERVLRALREAGEIRRTEDGFLLARRPAPQLEAARG